MTRIIKWGIIGLGKIANKFASDLMLDNNSVLHAVASRNKIKAEEFGEKFNAISVYGSYEEIVVDSKVDIIYVATTNNTHFPITMMCLEHNKHVLCEKPMGLNYNEVKTMVSEARKRNLFLMEAIWTRFIPSTEKLLDLIDNNVIGDISIIKADFGFKGDRNPAKRLFNKELGGGSLLDIGIYPVYLSLLLMGIPEKINSKARISDTGVDSYCWMELLYANNSIALLESTFEVLTPTEAYIYGEYGVIKMHSRFHHTERISMHINEKPDTHFEEKYTGNGYYHEILEVAECIRKGLIESPKLPHNISLDLIKTMDKVRDGFTNY